MIIALNCIILLEFLILHFYTMSYKTIFVLSLLCFATFAQNCCDLNMIKVSGNADVKVKPDYATIEVGA